MNKRYTVISLLTPRGPEYRIYDQVTGATLEGGFDTQRWAESVAEMMEEKWKRQSNGKTKNRTPRGVQEIQDGIA